MAKLSSYRSLTPTLSIIKSLDGLQQPEIGTSARLNLKFGILDTHIKMPPLFFTTLRNYEHLSPLLHLLEPEDTKEESLKN